MHDRVKDKTLQQLAGDVQQQIKRLDASVADFIRGLGEDSDDQEIVEQIVPVVSEQTHEAPEGADPEQAVVAAAAATALEQAADEENELEP